MDCSSRRGVAVASYRYDNVREAFQRKRGVMSHGGYNRVLHRAYLALAEVDGWRMRATAKGRVKCYVKTECRGECGTQEGSDGSFGR